MVYYIKFLWTISYLKVAAPKSKGNKAIHTQKSDSYRTEINTVR